MIMNKKRILYSLTSLILLCFTSAYSQVFWTETFGVGCSQGNLAAGAAPTASNGAWAVTALAAFPGNDPQSNTWFISATEAGVGVGNCGDGCLNNPLLTNRSLHVGSNLIPFLVDPGAAYLAGPGLANTNKRAESPTINCAGQTAISLTFNYIAEGIAGADFAEVVYSDNGGVTWATISPMPITANGFCLGQGLWTSFTVALPASANNNPNVKVGFRWENSDPTGQDPSVAIDDVQLLGTSSSAAPTFTIPASACAGANIALSTTVAATNYTWSVLPAGALIANANVQNTNVVFPNAGTFTITASAGSPTPVATFTQTITINPAPAINIAPVSPVNVCLGGSITYTASGATSYTWFAPPFTPFPATISTSSLATVSPTSNTTYTVLGATSGCTAFALASANINPNLTIFVTPASPSVCAGSTVQLTANNATSYTWVAPPNNTISTGPASVIVAPTVATTYTVFGSVGSCSGSVTVQVGISPPFPLIVAASSPTVCPGGSVTLSAGGATTYTWLPAGALTPANGATTIATPTTSTTYTVNGTLNGCAGRGTITVNTNISPPVSIAATSSAVCQNYQATLTANGAANYSWTGTPLSGTFTAVNIATISVFAGTYTVVGSNGGICTTTATIKIDTLPPLNIQVSQSSFTTCVVTNNNPCLSKPITLIASGATNYQWSPPCPSFLSLCVGPTVTARPCTTSSVQVIGTTATCSGTAVVTVSVIPQFTIAVVPIQPITCLGSCINMSITGIGNNVPGPITYSWTEASNALATLDDPLSRNVVACPTVNTTYTAVAFDNRGCISAPRLVSTTILPVPAGTITSINNASIPTNTICFVNDLVGNINNTLTLQANPNNPGLPPGVIHTYTWTSGNGLILTNINAPNVIVTASSIATPLIYTLSIGYNGISGCLGIDTIAINVIDCRKVTTVSFTTATQRDTLCTGQCVTFTNTTNAAQTQTLVWQFPGGTPNTSTLQAPNVCYNLPGKYNVTLTSRNSYNLPGELPGIGFQGYITVVDIPNPQIRPVTSNLKDTLVQFGTQVVLTASNATWYNWSPTGANVSCNSCISPTFTALQNMQVILTGYNSRKCISTDTLDIIVLPDCGEMFVPTAFSPNNDGVNDILYARGRCLETLKFQVFSRWGQLVFETTDAKKGWDGFFNGELMNTGVFFYRLEGKGYDRKGYSYKGNVTLIR